MCEQSPGCGVCSRMRTPRTPTAGPCTAHTRQSAPDFGIYIRQSGPDSGLSFQVEVRKAFQVVPSLLSWKNTTYAHRRSLFLFCKTGLCQWAAVERSRHILRRQDQIVRAMFLGGVPGEQNMLKEHLPRVIDHRVYY
jgi:hypothetical protein